MKTRRLINIFAALSAIFLSEALCSCSGSDDAFPRTEEGKQEIELHLAIYAPESTRADNVEPDPSARIDNVLVMMFTEKSEGSGVPETLWRALEASDISDDLGGGKRNFDVKFRIDPVSTPRRLVVVAVANATDRLNDIKAGERNSWSYEDCRMKLLTDQTTRDSQTPDKPFFTIWGIAEKPIDTSLQVQGARISMVRDMARVLVNLSDDVVAENFRIAYALVYNRFNGISMMPKLSALSSSLSEVERPTIVDTVDKTECESFNPNPWSDTPASWSMYVAEQDILMGREASVSDANRFRRPALIVGGYYRGKKDKVYWYRVDFLDSDGNLIDVVRNHSYSINVSAVNGPGEDSPEEAYNSLATHLQAEIAEWNDVSREAAFDGSNWIAAPREASLGNEKGSKAVVAIWTNVAPDSWEYAWGDPGDEWDSLQFADVAGAGEAISAQGEFCAVFPEELGADGSAAIEIKALGQLPENVESRSRTLYINITPRLRLAIPVVQSASDADGGHHDWKESNIFNEI